MNPLFTLAASIAVVCPQTSLIDWTGQPWGEEDYKFIFDNKEMCIRDQPELPCTYAITKTNSGYIVTCGAPLKPLEAPPEIRSPYNIKDE